MPAERRPEPALEPERTPRREPALELGRRPGLEPGRDRFRWSTAVYRRLLRAYPRPFRDRFADDMAEDFAALCDTETREAGPAAGRARAWRRALADLALSTLRERRLSRSRSARIANARHIGNAGAPGGHSFNGGFLMIAQEVRFAARRLRRTPGFALAALLTLGLGVGGTTAVFSVLQAVVLRPLPFPDPQRLVRLWELTPQGGNFSTSEPNFLDFRARLRTIEDLTAYRGIGMTLLGRGDAVRLQLTLVSHRFFALTGGAPALGRTFAEAEDRAGGDTRVIVLAHGSWQRRFGGDPAIVGQTIRLDDQPYAVIGVLPRTFDFPAETDGYVPLAASATSSRGNHMLRAIGRMRDSATLDEARADAVAVARALSAEYPVSNGGWGVRLDTFDNWMIGPQLRRTLLVLLGAAALLLVVACVNVANLVMVRATSRRKELAMQAALGAGRWRIVRGLLTESLLLASIGGALGTFLAYLAVPVLRRLAPAGTVPRLAEAAVDGTVLIVAIAISAAVGLCFGMLPALLQTRAMPQDWLRDSTGGSAGTGRHRVRELLMAGEIALAMMLLVGAALLVDSFRRLQTVDVGFDAANVFAVSVTVSGGPYAGCAPDTPGCDPAAAGRRRGQYFQEAQRRIASLPGVVAVGATNITPLAGDSTSQEVTIEGYVPNGPDDVPFIDWRIVSGGFFRAMSMPMVRGRTFTDADATASVPVVIVSAALATRYWPGQDPIGKRLSFGRNGTQWRTIVGVAHDMRDVRRDLDPQPIVYLSGTPGSLTLVVRTEGTIDGTASAIRRELQAIDGAIPIPLPEPLTRNLARTLAPARFSMLLMGLFAGVALVLAALGVYGVTAYGVALRTREIGVRLALGAEPGQMVRMILSRGLLLAVAGILTGSVGAFLLSGFLRSLLFETRPADLRSHALVAVILAGVAVVAIVIPARRASRIDPRQALIAE